MPKYSRIYKVGNKRFRYNYKDHLLEWVWKPDAQMIRDNEEWSERHGEPLWKITDGEHVVDTSGLSLANWKNDKEYYLDKYAHEIECECRYLAAEFEKEFNNV